MTDEFNDHICYFRHALALDERRVKFQPEYICGGESYKPPPLAEDPNRDHVSVKEVWFAGCHSDIGGGNKDNTTLNNAAVPVLWMGNEALIAGLRLDKSRVVWKWGELEDQNKDTRDSLTRAWLLFEILPFKRLSYTDRVRHTWRPHLAGVRVIKPHQKVHASVAFIKDYTPKATLLKSETEIEWARICDKGVKDNVKWSDGLENFLEMDLFDYANAPVIVMAAKDDPDNPFFMRRLKFMASFLQGARAIYDADPKFELFCKMLKSDGEAKTVGALLLCKVASWVTTASEVMLDDLPEDKDQWIAMRDNKLGFNILEPEIVKYGLKRTFHELDPSASDAIIDVLMQAASYFHLFNLDKSAARNSVLKDKINIEFKRLKNSTLDEPNLFCDGVINVNVSEEDAEYALKVTNNTSEDFFLAVWTFEPINFDFNDKTAYKQSPTGHSELDQTLKGHGGSVTVGHGSPRVTPFSYDFAYGQKVDVVFLKLFFFPFLELDNVAKVHPLQFLLDPTHPPSGTILIPVLVRQAS